MSKVTEFPNFQGNLCLQARKVLTRSVAMFFPFVLVLVLEVKTDLFKKFMKI